MEFYPAPSTRRPWPELLTRIPPSPTPGQQPHFCPLPQPPASRPSLHGRLPHLALPLHRQEYVLRTRLIHLVNLSFLLLFCQ
jgi:hypothetical protein